MKSIEDTLKLIDKLVHSFHKKDRLYIALAGGYAAIAHGVERTTADIDFCIYADFIQKGSSQELFLSLKEIIPERFETEFIEGTKFVDDPFQHDIIFLNDKLKEYPRIDFIIARYKWELEGLKEAGHLEDIPFPVLPKPYLIAMKLKAGSLKDDYDIVELYKLASEDEKRKTRELARLIKKEKKLLNLLKRSR